MIKSIAIVLAFLAVLEYCSALQCYNCTHAQKECLEESFDKSKIAVVNCQGLSLAASQGSGPVCLLKVSREKRTGITTVYRKCLPVSSPNDCKSASTDLEIVNCKTCDTDLCNTSASSGISSTAVLFAVPLFYMFTKMIIN